LSFSDVLETLDSDRGPWDLDLSAKMEALDPSRAKILRSHVAFKILSCSDLLETLDSDRGLWDLDLNAKMEALDPSRAEILRYL